MGPAQSTLIMNCLLQGQLNWRTEHSNGLLRDKLYCWGERLKDLLPAHDSENKRKITQIYIF